MIRFFSVICGVLIVIVMGGMAAGQDTGRPAQRRGNHLPRQVVDPQNPQNPNTPTATQYTPVVAQQQPPAQPAQGVPQGTPAPPAATANPVAQAPEHMPPPSPALVTYQNGLLTVQAMNSTLGGLLTAIRNKTGIQFEGLEGGAQERVAIAMGPAPESDVLAAILGGSNFDYVVLGRPDSPGIVQRVLLMPRGGAAPTVAGAQPARPAAGEDDEDAPDEQASGDPEPQDTPARPPVSQAQPPQPQDQQLKTPEQLMQQLQQMQQQRQLQLQQQQQQQQQQQVPPQNQAPIKPPSTPQ